MTTRMTTQMTTRRTTTKRATAGDVDAAMEVARDPMQASAREGMAAGPDATTTMMTNLVAMAGVGDEGTTTTDRVTADVPVAGGQAAVATNTVRRASGAVRDLTLGSTTSRSR
jgi:hypothetical protein